MMESAISVSFPTLVNGPTKLFRRLQRSPIIRGPVMIGERCNLRNSFVGPFTSVGNDTEIADSIIQHAVLLEGCRLQGINRLEDSLLGRNVTMSSRGSQGLYRM